MRLPSILKKSVALLVLAGFTLGVTGCQPAAAPPATGKTPAASPGKPGGPAAPTEGEKAEGKTEDEKPADADAMPSEEAVPGEQAGSGENTGAEPSNPGDAN